MEPLDNVINMLRTGGCEYGDNNRVAFNPGCHTSCGDARCNEVGSAMDPTTSFGPSDSPELPGPIVVNKEWVTRTISILPVVEVREK